MGKLCCIQFEITQLSNDMLIENQVGSVILIALFSLEM